MPSRPGMETRGSKHAPAAEETRLCDASASVDSSHYQTAGSRDACVPTSHVTRRKHCFAWRGEVDGMRRVSASLCS
ncbi:hypothetical protein NDU88_007157 [Pleurodeles waltl]|uniref:Uncharacterized protein n=1 Tax=Pleurodeles waltl TaxID=8319 RepID=A0AAV7QK24_PLEWA|nr:hypothetical protein NDU88_007157 [Pleurodeles waltl]